MFKRVCILRRRVSRAVRRFRRRVRRFVAKRKSRRTRTVRKTAFKRLEKTIMTIDKSLKIKKGVTRSRNVLTRVERIEKMQATDRWTDETSPFNLPKIRVYKVVLKKKKKVKDADDAPAKGKK